jgi:hypothetical protein
MMSRANPLDSFNLDDFQTKPAEDKKPKQDREAIAKIAEANGFPSRQAPVKASTERPRQHYFRTGRNVQMAIKGTAECHDQLQRLVEELDVPKGVILEEALKALEAIKSSPQLTERLDQEFPRRRSQKP